MRRFGFYDTTDDCWIGDDEGPRLVDDPIVARIGARVLDVRLGYEPGRVRARAYDAKTARFKDTIEARLTLDEALQVLESRKKL